MCENNLLRKNNYGLWEMYLEGDPFEMGVVNGKLTKELISKQERAFVNEIKKAIPSETARKLIGFFIAYFNKDIDKYIDKENLLEIYGISKSADELYDEIGPAYQRLLNYHAAHDIAYSMQGLMMSGCTSFAAWDDFAEDSSMIVGRNFDFYAGDEFAEDKIVCFYNPDNGYKFVFVTWGGMIGAVSGMNEKGLTVTLNSAKTNLDFQSGTPVSLLAREILQYSENISDAYRIASQKETSVAVSFLICSAADKRAVIIEKAGSKMDTVASKENYIVCTNHFMGDAFQTDMVNAETIKNGNTLYRYQRATELLLEHRKLDYSGAAEILRDTKGLNNLDIGMGNEKAINPLIAHHSVIFDPENLYCWVSSNPFQMGAYVGYDFKKVFEICPGMKENKQINNDDLTIPADTFLSHGNFSKFILYKKRKDAILENTDIVSSNEISDFIMTNPRYFFVYKLAGDCYLEKKDLKKAAELYKKALEMEFPSVEEKKKVMNALTECY